jgi:hypothetical protein
MDRPDVELTPEQEQRFDDLTARAEAAAARVQAADAAINAVDPAPGDGGGAGEEPPAGE